MGPTIDDKMVNVEKKKKYSANIIPSLTCRWFISIYTYVFCNDFIVFESWESLTKPCSGLRSGAWFGRHRGNPTVIRTKNIKDPHHQVFLVFQLWNAKKLIWQKNSSTPSPSLSPAAWLNRPWLSNSQVNKKHSLKKYTYNYFPLSVFVSFSKINIWLAWSEVSLSVLCWHLAQTFGHIQSSANFGPQLVQI